MKEISRIIYVGIAIILIAIISIIMVFNSPKERVNNLVIFGNNIKTSYLPFIEDDNVFVSIDTIRKVIDKNIYFDDVTSKVIITTYDKLVKYKLNDSNISVNFNDVNINTFAKKYNDMVYLPVNTLEDVYNFSVSFNKDLNTITIDKKDNAKGKINRNFTYVYDDINTKSKVISILSKGDEVITYLSSLNHNRWYKIKTSDNIVGYIFKDSLDIISDEDSLKKNEDVKDEKISMYFQYGNNVDFLTKEPSVNVVSPTLYEVSNVYGDIKSKKAKDYVDKAKRLGYKVWPIITNGIDDVNYSSNDTSLLMNSEESRENLIKNIVDVIKRDKLDGINIDFENMRVEDKNKYSQFIRELAPMVRSLDATLSADIYFVNYIDRAEIGNAVDYLILMGYDQRGSWSNESGSISEIPWVDKNIKSLINDSKVPKEKIILGIPFYTRLWTETKGNSKPKTTIYTIKQTEEFVKKNNLIKQYDEKSGQNYVEFSKGIYTYKMWIEDKVSIKNRIDVVNSNDIAGIAAWRKNFETSDIWQVIYENLK